jgi:hypothetical protein
VTSPQIDEQSSEVDLIIVIRIKQTATSEPGPAHQSRQNDAAPKPRKGIRREAAYSEFKASDVLPFKPAPEGPARPGQLIDFDDNSSMIVNFGDEDSI